MSGFIYIMSNEIFKDDRLKIGISKSDPRYQRKAELDSETGVPEPFRVEYFAFVEDYQWVEREVHKRLDSFRPNKRKEFFTCSRTQALETIRQVAKIEYEKTSLLNEKSGQEENLDPYVDEQGVLIHLGNYEGDKKSGLWIYFHANGQKKEQGKYQYGLREGVWETYQKDGTLFCRGNYQEGK